MTFGLSLNGYILLPMPRLFTITQALSISENEIRFRFHRSGGPGGQNVNKVSTRVELLFDVQQSPNLNRAQKQRILSSLKSRIGKDRILRVVVDESRSQWHNREKAIERLTEILRAALKHRKKRFPTKPSAAAHDKRIKSKRLRAEKKLKRRRVMTD